MKNAFVLTKENNSYYFQTNMEERKELYSLYFGLLTICSDFHKSTKKAERYLSDNYQSISNHLYEIDLVEEPGDELILSITNIDESVYVSYSADLNICDIATALYTISLCCLKKGNISIDDFLKYLDSNPMYITEINDSQLDY